MSIGIPNESSPLESLHLPADSAILVVDEDPAFHLGLKNLSVRIRGLFPGSSLPQMAKKLSNLIENEESIEVITRNYQDARHEWH